MADMRLIRLLSVSNYKDVLRLGATLSMIPNGTIDKILTILKFVYAKNGQNCVNRISGALRHHRLKRGGIIEFVASLRSIRAICEKLVKYLKPRVLTTSKNAKG